MPGKITAEVDKYNSCRIKLEGNITPEDVIFFRVMFQEAYHIYHATKGEITETYNGKADKRENGSGGTLQAAPQEPQGPELPAAASGSSGTEGGGGEPAGTTAASPQEAGASDAAKL